MATVHKLLLEIRTRNNALRMRTLCGDGWLAVNTNASAQCTEISIPKRDRHTYIDLDLHTSKTTCEAGLVTSR